ncbi:MAG: hypothetical protein OXH09_03810 [Gammaproteobacteria bacterium]|nr:hypothetical protein [Gammaproteobacteria bacterium]
MAAGIDHQLSNLRCLLAEAHTVGRLAVLPPLRLEARHNFGIASEWSWDTYFDLDASRLVGNDGRTHPLPFVRDLPEGRLNTRTVPPRGRLSGKECAELVVRQVRHEVFTKEVPLTNTPVFRLRPSATVLSRAGPVVEALRKRWSTGYAAVHIRRGDRLWGPMRWLTRPDNIRRRLRKLGIHEGDGVFFLSDERDAEYWSGLAPHYGMARYTDFPELVAIIAPSSPSTPDNYLLYEVEKEVVRHATAVVETFPLPRGERPQKTLVPIAVWVVARNVRRWWRSTRRFLRRCVRKSVKLAATATRRRRLARSPDK